MIVLETLARRWFAFALILAFLWAAWPEGGWRRAVRFLVAAAVVSFAAEYSSTHNGFPYGRYDYLAHTRGDELYVSNVPLFVPLSFGTVVYAGRALAVAGLRARTPLQVIAGGALCAAIIDLVIDPMTLRGDSWFLGELYAFRAGGYFGVPWSNFGGWVLVSAVILAADEAFRPGDEEAYRNLRGLAIAFGIMVFFDVLALATTHWRIAAAGIGITAALGALVSSQHMGSPGRLADA